MSGRTPEERERARLEREARRTGQPLPPEPPPPYEPPPAPPPQPPQAPPPYEPPTPEAEPQPPQPQPRRPRRSAADRRAAATEFLGRRRASGPPTPPPPPGVPGEGTDRRRWIIGIVAGVAALVLLWLLLSTFQPFAGEGSGKVTVTIPEGSGSAQIADTLEQSGVISSSFFFRARLALSGGGGDLKPGTFELARGMSNGDAIDAISTTPKSEFVTVTIPEGLSRAETARLVRSTVSGDYVAASRRSPELDPARYGGRRATSLEGFLFPATYELERGADARTLVESQLEAFQREIRKVGMGYARSKNLTVYDVLTIASMVDREAMLPRERPLVASVIYNRLREGMPLGIDATIRFAADNWTEPLTQSQLAIDSPYNTRERSGLPPGPIGSPGLAAIRAAAHPARTGYLFYVVKPGTCGEHAFSEDDAQFQRDVDTYNSERARAGGRSPTDC